MIWTAIITGLRWGELIALNHATFYLDTGRGARVEQRGGSRPILYSRQASVARSSASTSSGARLNERAWALATAWVPFFAPGIGRTRVVLDQPSERDLGRARAVARTDLPEQGDHGATDSRRFLRKRGMKRRRPAGRVPARYLPVSAPLARGW